MLTFFTIMLILGTASVHELGHAWAMRERGVAIKRISLIGLPWPRIMWRLPIRSKKFPDTEWVVHPLILGAYVQPVDEKAMETMPPNDAIYIAAMGPIASVLIGVVLMGFAVTAISIDGSNALTMKALYAVGTTTFILMLTWYLRVFIARFICLLLGIVMVGLIIWTVVQFGLMKSLAGPVGLVDMIHTYAGSETDVHRQFMARGVEYFAIWNAFYFAGIISLAIGATNLLPLVPLDGGHIMAAHMPKRWHVRYKYVSGFLFIALIALAFTSDGLRILNW